MNYFIRNANIWTADESLPKADCIAIKENLIEYVGCEEEYLKGCNGKETTACSKQGDWQVIDAGGRMIVPAFMDSHTHVEAIAKTMWCFLIERKEYESIDEIMNLAKDYAAEHPKEEVPYMYVYSCPTRFLDQDFVDRYYMDQFISDRPVLLCDENYHRCVVNSKMLELMEIDETTPYHENTSCNYERYDNNVPNGIIEERAFEFYHDIDKMFDKLGWYPPSERDPEVLWPVLDIMSEYGLTALCDGWTETEDALMALKELEEEGRLNHYFFAQPLLFGIDNLEETIATAKAWKAKYEDDRIHVNSIKLFLDGTNELGTGAVLEPFVNDVNDFGVLIVPEEELVKIFERLNQENLGIQLHLVGDRAFRVALNAAEKAQKKEFEAGRKFTSHITLLHCELTHPDDRLRPGKLGVYINFTPVWANGLFGDASLKYLGQERFDSLYSFNDMIKSGAVVNFSADMVDEEGIPMSGPLLGIQTGSTRKAFDGTGPARPHESECISVEDMLKGYTINNAKALGIESIAGSLTAGKRANLCVLSEDIFEVPKEEINQINVDLVMFEGSVIKGDWQNGKA